MTGKLYGVGVGPGDPELMTIKAVNTIKSSDLIALPAAPGERCTAYEIARGALPELDDKEKLYITMPMTKDERQLEAAHSAGARQLAAHLEQGQTIAFLTLGDPCVYSTYMYLHKRVCALGYEAAIISGIPSFCAAAATLGCSLAEGSEQIHVIPATGQIDAALALPGTKVLMKSGRNLGAVKQQLSERGMKAVMVENCGMADEKQYHSLEEIPDTAGYFSLIITKEG